MVANETRSPGDFVLNHYQTFGREPFGYAIGPIKDAATRRASLFTRGTSSPNGVPLRVDMTHSVTQSMLSSVIGVAYDHGMIGDINDTVQSSIAPIQAFGPQAAHRFVERDLSR